MNTPSNVATESSLQSAAVVSAEVSSTQRFYWAVRRELWEYRSIYLAPVIVGAIALLGFFVSLFHLPARMRAAGLDPMQQHAVIEQPFVIIALMLMLIDMVVAVFYSLDALYGERRDRSVLFWKSLPVSDLTTVIAKASIPILVLPVVVAAVTIATQFAMLVTSSIVLAASGAGASLPWIHVPFFKTAGVNLYHLVVFHGIYYAPFFGWMLLVSAWAKRAPLLWAVLPPVAIAVVEKMAFNTSYFGMTLVERFGGGSGMGSNAGSTGLGATAGGMTMEMFTPHHAIHFMFSPGMWIGIIFTAGCLLVATRVRRMRAAG